MRGAWWSADDASGDEQLELERLQVALRVRSGREAVRDGEDRVHLAQAAEQRRSGAGNVDDADRRRRDLARAHERRQLREPVVRDRRHADVLLAEAGAASLRQRREQRRLARARQADDSHFERHLAAPDRLRLPAGGTGLRPSLVSLASLQPEGRTSVLSLRPTHREQHVRCR